MLYSSHGRLNTSESFFNHPTFDPIVNYHYSKSGMGEEPDLKKVRTAKICLLSIVNIRFYLPMAVPVLIGYKKS